ncbi:MAG: transporter substrate-binding domain-containing protein [Pseudomonadota bacterium]
MRSTVLAALPALALSAPMASAEGHAGCPVHIVSQGETLSIIAEAYYGELDVFEDLYEVNREIIGEDVDVIEEGIGITLPCTGPLGARLDQAAVAALARPATSEVMEEAPPEPEIIAPRPSQARVAILTGGPFAPFVDEARPTGGLFTELMTRALRETAGPPGEVVFVNDRESHLWDLMPRGGFDITGPWFYPDCTSATLPAMDRELCDAFVASIGYYEFVTEFYARADTEWATVVLPGGLTGARLCVPAGYPRAGLAALGLAPEAISTLTGRSPADCLLRLDRQNVDVVAMEAAVTRALIDDVQVENPIVVLETLSHVDRLRILVRRDHPDAESLVARLDTALETMSADGAWFEIVTRHLLGQDPA